MRSVRSKKRLVYVVATVATMAIFTPFQRESWSIYVAACVGYTILVFGLRRVTAGRAGYATVYSKPVSAIVLTHLTFLLIAVGWDWLCVILRTHLPYFLRTEDTSRPYFGLAFLGILGLMCLEAVEQWYIRLDGETGAFEGRNNSYSSVARKKLP